MAQFEVAIFAGKLLKRSTLDLMWSPLKPSDGSKDSYGLGSESARRMGSNSWLTMEASKGPVRVFRSAPDQRAGVVVLTNMDGLNPDELATEILKILVAGPSKK